MYEVEVKVRADHDAVRAALEAAGAERLGVVTQTDTYYDAPDRDFAETDEALRVRREAGGDGERTLLTYKGPLVDEDTKTREEHEVTVEDADALDGLLRGLGYEPAATVAKERERFALDGYAVTLDDVEGLGTFVEVEREVPEREVEAARAGAWAVLEDVGLGDAGSVRTSYLGLLLAREE